MGRSGGGKELVLQGMRGAEAVRRPEAGGEETAGQVRAAWVLVRSVECSLSGQEATGQLYTAVTQFIRLSETSLTVSRGEGKQEATKESGHSWEYLGQSDRQKMGQTRHWLAFVVESQGSGVPKQASVLLSEPPLFFWGHGGSCCSRKDTEAQPVRDGNLDLLPAWPV